MAKQRIDPDTVISQAVAVVDTNGLDDLSLARVAGELGVRSSALYNHVDGVDGLRQAVAERSSANLADALRDAAVGRSGEQALRAVALAYRTFAATHPGQYASTLLPVERDTGADSTRWEVLNVLARILETYEFDGDTAVHMARIVRSAIHGFVTLEASQDFSSTQDTDASFDELVDFIVHGLNTRTTAP